MVNQLIDCLTVKEIAENLILLLDFTLNKKTDKKKYLDYIAYKGAAAAHDHG